jgi:hypothetical protein
MSVNPDGNEELRSQLSTYFKRHVGFGRKRILRLCLRAAGETPYHARKYPRLASAGRRRPWISASCLFIVFLIKALH